MRILFILLIAGLLTGCTTTRTVYVPTGCPKINIPTEPQYPLQNLKANDTHAVVAREYAATLQLQHDYIGELKHVCQR